VSRPNPVLVPVMSTRFAIVLRSCDQSNRMHLGEEG
jgi:hypothetical protein